MERGKVKHSNNRDSCFSLFGKIHFVLLSAPSSSCRDWGLIQVAGCLGTGLISGARKRVAQEEKKKKLKKGWVGPGHGELRV